MAVAADARYCFILMPFGRKPGPNGVDIDFDQVYEKALMPGVQDAGLSPLRADQESLGGIIHGPMYERLMVCEFAVADLTAANANVLYELGVRHAARPGATLLLFAGRRPRPFDVANLRMVEYELEKDNSFSDAAAGLLRSAVAMQLLQMREAADHGGPGDSPVFRLVDSWRPEPLVPRDAASFFEEWERDRGIQERLSGLRAATADDEATAADIGEVAAIADEVRRLATSDPSLHMAVLSTLRAVEDWSGMIDYCAQLPYGLGDRALFQQQLAFAYGRRSDQRDNPHRSRDRSQAQDILLELEQKWGPSAETSGLLGGLYKRRWMEYRETSPVRAAGELDRAIEAYCRGFDADPRDIYPGINAVTLLEIRGDEESLARARRLLPVVDFAARRRLSGAGTDYWDAATMLELAVLGGEEGPALRHLSHALIRVDERWKARTTAANLRLIQQARSIGGRAADWISPLIEELDVAGRPATATESGRRPARTQR